MSLIEIRPPASLEEYDQACALVEDVYYEHGITIERAMQRHPKAIFVAVRDGEVVGSVGFQSADQGALPVEHFFAFDVAEACSLPRPAVFEVVKLAASERKDHTVFRGLIAACLQYAFSQESFGLGVAIAKPRLQKALNYFLRVPTGHLPYQFVSERTRNYPQYFCAEDAPTPVTVLPAERDVYLPRLIAELAGKATLCTRDFDHRRNYNSASSYTTVGETALAA